jgi:Uma2 family endonuclease
LIAEVLSQSTQTFDLGQKFEDYQQIPDLEEYVLIDQEQRWVECRRRQPDNTWATTVYKKKMMIASP